VALFCKRTFTGLAGLAVVATGFACGGGDPPPECVGPEAQGAMPDFSIIEGESLTRRVRQYFIDPNNDPEELEYKASTADESVAVVSKIDNLYDITVDGVGVGNTRITVTAIDPCDKELTATQEAAVNVGHPNRPPFEPPPGIPDFVGENAMAVGEVRELELRQYITDPDGDVLRFTAGSSDDSVVTCNLVNDTMVPVTGVAPGLVTCTVTATDPDGLSVTVDFQVEVVDDEG